MVNQDTRLAELAQLIRKHAPDNGLYQTALHQLLLFRESEMHGREAVVYEPALIIAAQGRKYVYLDGTRYEYSAGNFLALFMPMAVECEMIGVSESEPMLAVGVRLDRHRLAKLLLKMDGAGQSSAKPQISSTSGIFTSPVKDSLLDATIRLLRTLDDPVETTVLGESILDEIYYRILSDEQGGALKVLLRQQGQIQQISKAVEHLNKNLDKNVSVDDLAGLVGMSSSGFHKKFKEVMHVSPLQYTKLIRLNKAKAYIMEGKNVSEAGYLVGYNSPAQFSREYKRQFGVSPSAT
ncbi:MAG: AraC family transcriptional regulator [Candidatus Thiodiazotropha sp. (ex Codakia orbicularis)]|nr:AraC family transcriptional regulator [Candidatus Thiodiazotropha sp. (ex Codakia orbicularis)]